jgi:hypothetical protein
MLQNSPPQKNLVLEIEPSLGTLEVRIVFKLRTRFEHLQLDLSFFLVTSVHTTKGLWNWKLLWGKVDLDLILLIHSIMILHASTWVCLRGSIRRFLIPCMRLQIQATLRYWWCQLEYSLIQASNLILNRRWLIQNLGLMWHCFFPSVLVEEALLWYSLYLAYRDDLSSFWVISGSLVQQPPKHCIMVVFSYEGVALGFPILGVKYKHENIH